MRRPSAPPAPAGYFMASGVMLKVNAQVRAPSPQLTFRGLPRRLITRYIVLHWTGAENDARRVFLNMAARKLSVHFIIEPDGIITQACDANLLCSHARGVNQSSIGIELVCRGDAPSTDAPADMPARTMRTETIHGQEVTYADFTDRQKEAAAVLVGGLSRAYGVPARVPMAGGEVVGRALSGGELARFSGVIGHYHVRDTKRDPGTALLAFVHQANNPQEKFGWNDNR